MTWFSEIITEQDNYLVQQARAEIAFRTTIACITARNITVLIDSRFPDWAPTHSVRVAE